MELLLQGAQEYLVGFKLPTDLQGNLLCTLVTTVSYN